jgi:hypothetical protein
MLELSIEGEPLEAGQILKSITKTTIKNNEKKDAPLKHYMLSSQRGKTTQKTPKQ